MKRPDKSSRGRPGFWEGALFGGLVGIGSLLVYQYFNGILRQPRLISRTILSEEGQFENRDALALFIAAENLYSGIERRSLARGVNKQILHAGYRNFRESWARDFGFASYGLLALEKFETVKDTLDAFLWHQNQEGQLPVKLYSIHVVTRFFYSLFDREQPTMFTLKPKYASGHGAPSLDGQAMLVVAGQNYAQTTGDTVFLEEHWEQLKLAMQWLQGYRKDSSVLLSQGAYADWADSVARRGRVLYTNLVYWKALTAMGLGAERLGRNEESIQYFREADAATGAIQDEFWRPELGYFVTSKRLDQFSSAGNLLAIAWGLAETDQTESILAFMEKAEMAKPVPTRVAHPAYPLSLIAIENVLGGLANYHTEASWLWIGAWHVIALVKSGHMDQAYNVMERIVEVIIRDKKVNEVHAPDGEPLDSFWYKSESPLTWNAGMVIYAYSLYEAQMQAGTNLLSILGGTKE